MIFKHKYIGIIFIKPSHKCNCKTQIHKDFILSENSVPNNIGGGCHRMSVENIDMDLVRPYVISSCLDY